MRESTQTDQDGALSNDNEKKKADNLKENPEGEVDDTSEKCPA